MQLDNRPIKRYFPKKKHASIECAFRFRSEIFVAFASVSGLKPSPLRSERLRAVPRPSGTPKG